MMKKIIIFTDCALDSLFHDPDDALALIYFLENKSYEVESIVTTFGNTAEDKVFESVNEVLALGNYKSRVVRGAKSKNDLDFEAIKYFQSIDPSRYILISMGPLTNFKHLPKEQLMQFQDVFVMGGAIRVPGNRPPFFRSEFNFQKDPEAVEYLFNSRVVNLVPLDSTRSISTTQVFISSIQKRWGHLGLKIDRWNTLNKLLFLRKGLNPHDLVLAIALTNPHLFEVEQMAIKILNGQTIETKELSLKHTIFFIRNPKPILQTIEKWIP